MAKAQTVLPEAWTSMMTTFRTEFGQHIPDEKLPAQSYYEAFADKLAIGALEAEPSLSMVVGAFGEELQERNKRDPIRQYGLSLDAKLRTVGRKDSTRQVCHHDQLWLLAQMKHQDVASIGISTDVRSWVSVKSCSTRTTSISTKKLTALSFWSPNGLIVCSTNSSYVKRPTVYVERKVRVSKRLCGLPSKTRNTV